MRPNGTESIRAIQAAMMESLAPELQSEFARNTLQTIQMLLESLAVEWDTAAADQHKDNAALALLLSESAAAISALPAPNDRLASFVPEIEGILTAPRHESLVISQVVARSKELGAVTERLLACFEDVIDDPECASLRPAREAIYGHLRGVAARGWSFWDAASFRERMARERTA